MVLIKTQFRDICALNSPSDDKKLSFFGEMQRIAVRLMLSCVCVCVCVSLQWWMVKSKKKLDCKMLIAIDA